MNKTSHGGKVDTPRPQSISAKEMADNWDRIFGGVKKWTVTYTLDGVPHKNVYSTYAEAKAYYKSQEAYHDSSNMELKLL